jgi:hypothetical protein
MAKIHKPKYSKSEVSQKFNLKELLGYTPTDKQKEVFFDMAVDKMVQRTADGKDIDGVKFGSYAPYNSDYAKSKGVPKTAVDLIKDGDMLESNIRTGKQKNIVKIQVEKGTETLKSYNHNVGDTVPTRTYFGFKEEKDLAGILSTVDSLADKKEKKESAVSAFDLSALRAAVGRDIDIEFSGFDDGEN